MAAAGSSRTRYALDEPEQVSAGDDVGKDQKEDERGKEIGVCHASAPDKNVFDCDRVQTRPHSR